MKRDMEYVRELLLQIEEKYPIEDQSVVDDNYYIKTEKEKYHLQLLIEAGFINGEIDFDGEEYHIQDCRLTWAGHEFFDNIRSGLTWSKIKRFCTSKAIDLSIEAVKSAIPFVINEILTGV